jgi:hypothetical protein
MQYLRYPYPLQDDSTKKDRWETLKFRFGWIPGDKSRDSGEVIRNCNEMMSDNQFSLRDPIIIDSGQGDDDDDDDDDDKS